MGDSFDHQTNTDSVLSHRLVSVDWKTSPLIDNTIVMLPCVRQLANAYIRVFEDSACLHWLPQECH